MSEYEITDEVPVPEGICQGRPAKYPFRKMKVGDSFGYSADDAKAVAPSAHHYGRRHNMKFTCRNNGSGGRCWRFE